MENLNLVNAQNEIKSTIIAIGGAKGGIGKSLMAANLGVHLAAQGKRTVLVDLDLGAANLHLYLGIWSLPAKIDDFLKKRVNSIYDIVIPTKYNADLIGGGGGSLGTANIHFSRKLKLLRALKRIQADYVIFDLGGSTTFNILDFYLAADVGLVMTTCDPVSYLDAYTFIKMSLFRKLSRLFGNESEHRKERDQALTRLIDDFLLSSNSKQPRYIEDLLATIASERPDKLDFITNIISAFQPKILINMADERSNAPALAQRLKKVSHKVLSIDAQFIGTLPFSREIQTSAQRLVPHVAHYPQGEMAEFCHWIMRRIG
jgi:flagellar biosynthesis protein FlhG